MQQSTYYELNLVEGSDTFNPLVSDVPNYEAIDEAMHDNAVAGCPRAVEIKSGTVHALTRDNGDAPIMRFVATADFESDDTFTVDAVSVSAVNTAGDPLPNGAYKAGANVLAILTGTTLTILTNGGAVSEAANALKLDGQSAAYYAKDSDLAATTATANSASTIATANQTALNSHKLWSGTQVQYDAIVTKDPSTLYFIIAS